MSPAQDAELLVGVLALEDRVEAALVSATPFGRLRFGGRRLVEDNDGLGALGAFTPGMGATQDSLPRSGDDLAGDAWLGCIANAIAKLTFGLPAQRVRVGVAFDGVLQPDGVEPSGLFSTVVDPADRLASALLGRDVEVAGVPTFIERPLAVALGECRSALGCLAQGDPGLVLLWDRAIWWVTMEAGQEPSAWRAQSSELDYGFTALDRLRSRPGAVTRPLAPVLTAARRGDSRATDLLGEASRALAIAAETRLADLGVGARLVLAGSLGRATLDERLSEVLRVPFEAVLNGAPMSTDEEAPPAFHVSREEASPTIGAVAWALDAAAGGRA